MEERRIQKSQDEGKNKKVLNAVVFGIPNIIGLVMFLPLLIAIAMSFDAPGSGRHWAHWYFVISNVILGPLCFIGLSSKVRQHWGVIGYGIAASGWLVLSLVCAGKFTCR